MYFSIVVVTIPIYADNQNYGEILTVNYHLPPPLINLNPPEIHPKPVITDIEGENFKLYSHEFFTMKIPKHFVPDYTDYWSCPLHDQLCNYHNQFRNPLPEDANDYASGKNNQRIFIWFEPYSRYTNTLDLTNDATFDVPYILDEMQRRGYMKGPFSTLTSTISHCSYNEPPLDYGCKNLVITTARFMNLNGMPAYQLEYEQDWKQPSPHSPDHYQYDEEIDKKSRNFEHVSEIITTVFTKGFMVTILASTTHDDYLENPASWNDMVYAANSFDTINDVHKITDSIVFETINRIQNTYDDTLEIKSNQMEKLTQTHVPITFVTVDNGKVQFNAYEPEIIQKTEIVCGTGTVEKNGQCIPDYPDTEPSSKGGGCLIATATFGSELAPQVQQLRELRDNSLLSTQSGMNFMNTFNDFYYSFSPIIADYERENPIFKEMVKITITPMITSLSILNYVDMDSEESVLGYGISLIILNAGMYVVAPAIVIIRLCSSEIRKK